jgi:hypothetical protein
MQAIDRGEYKIRQEMLSEDLRNKKILGPNGMIPRLVKLIIPCYFFSIHPSDFSFLPIFSQVLLVETQ